MTDWGLVAKKLAFIETCVQQLRRLARPEQIENNVKEERFVAHTVQIAIQALDVASHIVSDERLGEPRTNRELFDLLSRGGWLLPDLAETMGDLVGFRNIVVHGYEDVDVNILRNIAQDNLEDLLVFAQTIRSRIDRDLR